MAPLPNADQDRPPATDDQPTRAQLLSLLVVVYGLLVAAGLVWLSWRERTAVIAQWAVGSRGLPAALVAGTGTGLGFFAVNRFLARYVRSLAELDRRLADALGPVEPRDAVVIAVVSGAAEEFFFRCAMQDALGPILAACLFGLANAIGRGMALWSVQAALFGLALGALVHFGHGVLAAALAHAVFNYLWLLSAMTR